MHFSRFCHFLGHVEITLYSYKTHFDDMALRFRVCAIHLLATLWPSGLRRWSKVPVRKGAGSNPAGVILLPVPCAELTFFKRI